ncbi:MAG: DUF349 domain-containing protein [Tannerella sp.]|jgi:hypothetical protein|nr:DUF349 domain-containing protein [Tannerella sp.]
MMDNNTQDTNKELMAEEKNIGVTNELATASMTEEDKGEKTENPETEAETGKETASTEVEGNDSSSEEAEAPAEEENGAAPVDEGSTPAEAEDEQTDTVENPETEKTSEEEDDESLSSKAEKKPADRAHDEQLKAANYALKLQLIERIKEICESQDDFNKLRNQFKEIQQRWKEAKPVPQEHANELWKNYQSACERFYELIKINRQFREYDFKKNLEAKTLLCEEAEKLEEKHDSVGAFHDVQKLYQQWREIGPVPKEFRESIWERFHNAREVVYKRSQEYSEKNKEQEKENLKAKTGICEQLEAIDFDELKSSRDWETKSQWIFDLQKEWKKIGFATRRQNTRIFERYRAACDNFFNRKAEFFKGLKEGQEKNLELKRALADKAEALQDSEDWKATGEELSALQKEWKSIGAVPRRYSDALWKRFIGACDHFFERRKAVDGTADGSIFHGRRGSGNSGDNRGRQSKPSSERDRLMRTYERLKGELQTYENNIGFLSVSSKGGSGLVKEMEKKMDQLREEMEETVNKIDAIDEHSEDSKD